MNKAGAKIPPNNPELKQIEVIRIFSIKIIATKWNGKSPLSIVTILSVPNPKTWGKKIPVIPQIIAPDKIKVVGEKTVFGAVLANHLIVTMKTIATNAKIGLQIKDAGRILVSSGDIIVVCNADSLLKIFSVTALDVKLVIAIGANALIEKCLRIASCAKIMPANGAPNPAEIAPATPQPRKTSIESNSRVNFFKVVPIVAPKWTNGPYKPIDAPPDALISAVKLDRYPTLMSNSLSVL